MIISEMKINSEGTREQITTAQEKETVRRKNFKSKRNKLITNPLRSEQGKDVHSHHIYLIMYWKL